MHHRMWHSGASTKKPCPVLRFDYFSTFRRRPNLLYRYWRVDWIHLTPPGPWWTAWRDGSSTPTTTTGKLLMMTFAYSSARYLFCVCRSIVSDFSWVCEEAWVPTLSQAMFFVGKHSKPMEELKGGDQGRRRVAGGYTFPPSSIAVTPHI